MKEGLYFKGNTVSDDTIVRTLTKDGGDYRATHIGNRIWVWENKSTGQTIITGDEGNSWAIKLTAAQSKEKALKQLKTRIETGLVFTDLAIKVLQEDGSEGTECKAVCKDCKAKHCITTPGESREEETIKLKIK